MAINTEPAPGGRIVVQEQRPAVSDSLINVLRSGVRSECQKINQILGQIEKDAGSGKEVPQLEELEEHLKQLRFHTMATVFMNLKYAHEQGIEDKLWHAHASVNTAYRHSIRRLKGSGQALQGGQRPVVLLRQVEKHYSAHLREAQYFYKGFISRLSAAFELPQLQRIANRTESDTVETGNSEKVDPRALNVHVEVTKSCYHTLLHLGDLSRYRMKQARNKKPNMDNTLAYYGLAQELLPTSGLAHHQMGVVFADDKKDFEIVYHFYRSLAVDEPHPNAAKNLAAEFSTVLAGNAQRNGNAPINPQQTFATWFLRLHARFAKGQVFQQQVELEKEVLHRLENLLKTPDTLHLLIKTVLINIAAYDVARKNVQGEWTMSGSQSCQFILRFHIRTMLTIARAILPEMDEALDHVETGAESSASFNTGLALIRICMAWMYSCRDDVVDYKQHLEPYVTDMHKTLTSCLTKFIKILETCSKKQIEFSTTPYLLPEDAEIIGLPPLAKWEALVVDGNVKPHFDEVDASIRSNKSENLGRVYDIVMSVLNLTSDKRFPYATGPNQDGGVVVIYAEDSQIEVPAQATLAPSVPAPAAAGELPGTTDQLPMQVGISRTAQQPHQQLNTHHSSQASRATAPRNQDMPQDLPGTNPTETDMADDSELLNRLGDFLAPPEAPARQPRNGGNESSYDMHTATAESVFGQVPQQSPTTRPVPSFSWDSIYKPTPYRSQEALGSPVQSASLGHGQPASSRSSRSFDGYVEKHDPRPAPSSRTTNSSYSSLPRVPDAKWQFGNDVDTSIRMERKGSNPAPRLNGTLDSPAMQRSISSSFPQRGQAAVSPLVPQRRDPWAQYRTSNYASTDSSGFPTMLTSTNFSVPSSGSLPPVQSPHGLAAAQAWGASTYNNYNLSTPQDHRDHKGAAASGQTALDGRLSDASTAWPRAEASPLVSPLRGGSMYSSPDTSDFNGKAREVILSMLDKRNPRG